MSPSCCRDDDPAEVQADDKVAILRLVLAERHQMSKAYEDFGVSPTPVYERQQLFIENGAVTS